MSDLDAFLARGRATHERLLMRDRVRLYRQGDDIFDRESGDTIPGPQTTFYTGLARVKPSGLVGDETEAGDRALTLREYKVDMPHGTTLPDGIRIVPGDLVEVTESPDPRMPGLILHVTGVGYSSTATAWSITAEDRS